MKRLYTALVLTVLLSTFAFLQAQEINHWEVIFDPMFPTSYFIGTVAPESDWNTTGFDDSNWEESPLASIGYGGMYDFLLQYSNAPFVELDIEPVTTIYTRTVFNIVDKDAIEELQLNLYHSDAFVAYLNGHEIYRENIGLSGDALSFNQYADTTRLSQADFYYNYLPPGTTIPKDGFKEYLKTGDNVLAIEVHNDKFVPEIHNYIVWVLAGLNVEENQYAYMDPYMPINVAVDSSNLPIIMVNTDYNVIPNEPKLMAHMQVSFDPNTAVNMVSPTSFHYSDSIGIELRGSSSLAFYPKKSYTIETRDSLGNDFDFALLDLPEESDWVLYAPFGDKTLLRNVLTYKISNDIGLYAPRTQYVEFMLNDKYLGTYVLVEKIKCDKNRVAISKLRNDEVAGDSLTGGYIIKIDKKEGEYGGWNSEYGSAEKENYRTFFQYVYPKHDEIVEEQQTYIQNFMRNFEESLRLENFEDEQLGYQKYIDVESFINFFIMNEFTKNMDGYRLSTFMYKDRDDKDGKLHMGPLWDFNLALGNYQAFLGNETTDWALDFGQQVPSDSYQLPFWWDRLLQDPSFVANLEAQWKTLRATTLHKDSIFSSIDEMVNYTKDSRERNFSVWQNNFYTSVWPNQPFASDYEGEITYLKSWISDRLDWIDANINEVRDEKTYVSIQNNSFKEFLAINAYPNPFQNQVNIEIELEAEHFISIDIFNTIGQKVVQIEHSNLNAGIYNYKWNGRSANGKMLNAGIYIYTIQVDNGKTYTGKIMKQ